MQSERSTIWATSPCCKFYLVSLINSKTLGGMTTTVKWSDDRSGKKRQSWKYVNKRHVQVRIEPLNFARYDNGVIFFTTSNPMLVRQRFNIEFMIKI
jgi:hypothetical protein